MVIAEILAPSEDIQTQIFNKTTSQLKKKKRKSTGENRLVGYSFPLLPQFIISLREKRNKKRLD